MGKLLSKNLKNKGDALYDEYKEKFTEDFENNKKVFNELNLPYSKKVRNLIIGYITRIEAREKKEEEAAKAPVKERPVYRSKPVSERRAPRPAPKPEPSSTTKESKEESSKPKESKEE